MDDEDPDVEPEDSEERSAVVTFSTTPDQDTTAPLKSPTKPATIDGYVPSVPSRTPAVRALLDAANTPACSNTDIASLHVERNGQGLLEVRLQPAGLGAVELAEVKMVASDPTVTVSVKIVAARFRHQVMRLRCSSLGATWVG